MPSLINSLFLLEQSGLVRQMSGVDEDERGLSISKAVWQPPAQWMTNCSRCVSIASRLASTPKGEIARSSSSATRRSTVAPPKPRQWRLSIRSSSHGDQGAMVARLDAKNQRPCGRTLLAGPK